MKRAAVGELHQALAFIGYQIADAEKAKQRFGATTRKAVLDLQKQHGLKQTGVVDAGTAALIDAQVKCAKLIIQGKIADQNGKPRPGLIVKAFDRNVGAEDTLLGKATTDEQGHYAISYTPDQLGGKAAADLVLSVYQGSQLLQTSDVIFNAQPIQTHDFVIAVAVPPNFSLSLKRFSHYCTTR